jgi:plastocyanin
MSLPHSGAGFSLPSRYSCRHNPRSGFGKALKLAGIALLLAALPSAAGTVSGSVELLDSKLSAVRSKKDYSGVVVWLEPLTAAPARLTAIKARMIQKDKTFQPHLLTVPVGAMVDFPNFDPIFHNAFSNYNGQLFDVGLYPPGASRSVRFNRPGVVRVFCNIHAAMSAVIVVLDSPYFDTTKKDGTFRIASVPPGDYWLRAFHERATQSVLEEAGRRITVTEDPVIVSRLSISESGYLEIPHKNKYGRDYVSEPDEHGGYSAPRK